MAGSLTSFGAVSVCAGGLLQLYSVTGDTRWLHWCQTLQATLDELFWDDAAGLHFAVVPDMQQVVTVHCYVQVVVGRLTPYLAYCWMVLAQPAVCIAVASSQLSFVSAGLLMHITDCH